jgi:hypothetical protein
VLWPSASTLCEYLPRSYAYEQQAELPKLTILEVHERYGPGCKLRRFANMRVLVLPDCGSKLDPELVVSVRSFSSRGSGGHR